MTGKQALVGWLGLGLVVANVLDGSLRPALGLTTQGGNTSKGKGTGGGGFHLTIPNPLDPFHVLPSPNLNVGPFRIRPL